MKIETQFKETEIGEWKIYKLSEIYEFSSGLSKGGKDFGFGYPFLTYREIFDNTFVPDKLTNLANSSEKERQRCSIKRGDVFLTRTSETNEEIGVSCVALKDYYEATFNGFTKRLRPKSTIKILPEYAGYYFKSMIFRHQVISMCSLTTRASLNNDILRHLTILVPDYESQIQIAKILKPLDDRIKVHTQQNKTLEAISQAIFKRWFIDFEFPNEEGKPYKSSGGEMVDSELGEIPKEWRIGKLGDIISNFDSKRIPLSNRERALRKGEYPYYGATSIMDYIDSYIFDGIYILMGEDGTVIDERGYPILQYVWGKFWVNNHAHIIKGRNGIPAEYVFLLLRRTNVKHIVTGAVQPKINQQNMNSLDIIIPPIDVLNQFSKSLISLFAKFRVNSNEIQSLSKIRDSLLPKLMSGKIRVKTEAISK